VYWGKCGHFGGKGAVQPGVTRKIVGPGTGQPALAFFPQGAAQALHETGVLFRRHVVDFIRPDRQQPREVACPVIGLGRGLPAGADHAGVGWQLLA